ncbi:hypothetical protein MAR_022586 [Mya arenaria]|uniref:Uncharacterized protein n=1 Tax=Mya arenaria TaxID=6604 RepID=A0ABY7DMU8_MYAAR|nr:hypothetical protein MAR_022586 [Mya arenaria]
MKLVSRLYAKNVIYVTVAENIPAVRIRLHGRLEQPTLSSIMESGDVRKHGNEDKDSEAKIRRTERIRRERPDFFNSLELDNQFKKKRKRKESTESRGRVSLSSPTEPEGKILQVEESEVPKKRRGRPRMSETKSPQPEEDWYAHLPSEKLMQYQIILAEINRKVSTQNFNPV